jgi:phosphodiesterase/alkaline phosphatase D-like protein
MRHVVRGGGALAVPELAHSVHVEVGGLDPRREYFFQFKYRDELSPVGRTLTAPARGTSLGSLAFAFASCSVGMRATTRRTGAWPRRISHSSCTSATTSTSTG